MRNMFFGVIAAALLGIGTPAKAGNIEGDGASREMACLAALTNLVKEKRRGKRVQLVDRNCRCKKLEKRYWVCSAGFTW